MRIEPMSPALLDDWLMFFDTRGFRDNPDWGQCYCVFFHFPGDVDEWGAACERGGNRENQIERIRSGGLRGYLAFDGDQPAGWLNAAPRTHYPKLDAFAPIEDRDTVGNLTCFVIDPSKRRRGIAGALLERACADFAATGMTYAEAFPPKQADSDAENFRGPLSLYERAGFGIVEEIPRHYRVRRAL